MKKVVVGIIKKVIDNQIKYLLMASTKDFGQYTGFYYPSGGHIEENEEEKEALIREIKEELNIDILPIRKIAETAGDVAGQITYWWKCELEGEIDLSYRKDEGVADIKWFSEEEIRKEEKIWPITRKVFLEYIFQDKNL